MSDARAPLPISADHARRFLVKRHLLDSPRALPATPESVITVVDRLGSLQFDPLEVPGARSHDLLLHSRISNYQRPWCDLWLYGPREERRLIELYNKSLNMVPMEELPLHRYAWERWQYDEEGGILTEHAALAKTILDHIEREGAVSTDAFRHVEHRVQWWWDSSGTTTTRAAKAVMESLFVIGRLGIARRDRSRRTYDLIERLVPADLLAARVPEEEQHRHRLFSRHRAVGLMAVGGDSTLILGTGYAPERARRTGEMVADGTLVPVAVEGVRETRYILGNERSILDATASPRTTPAGVAFLAPLDPILWDRRLLKSLFRFDYLWEIYVPAAKRRWGYYVLPILFGERLVGRIEPRLVGGTKTLQIAGTWFEDGFAPMEEPGFLPALADALDAYRRFVGARSVTWARTRPSRDLAGALRRIG